MNNSDGNQQNECETEKGIVAIKHKAEFSFCDKDKSLYDKVSIDHRNYTSVQDINGNNPHFNSNMAGTINETPNGMSVEHT